MGGLMGSYPAEVETALAEFDLFAASVPSPQHFGLFLGGFSLPECDESDECEASSSLSLHGQSSLLSPL